MADVFISYANDDGETARELASELEARGISVFFDKGVLVAGTDFRQEIAQALRTARAVVVLLSANTKRSSWVQEELSSVIEQADGPKVIPVMLDTHAKENWVWPLVSDRTAFDLSTHRERIGEVALQVSRLLLNESFGTPHQAEASARRRPGLKVLWIAAVNVPLAAILLFIFNLFGTPWNGSEDPSLGMLLWFGALSVFVGFVFGYLFSKWRR